MINSIVAHLYNKLIAANFQFADVIAGLVRTQSEEQPTDQESAAVTMQRYPVALWHNQTECQGELLKLVPGGNGFMKSMIYFEDNGTSPTTWYGRNGYSTSIRLVFWMNRDRLIMNTKASITDQIEQQLIELLAPRRHENGNGFKMMLGEANRIPAQDASIFSRYSYKEVDKQYLMTPYDFFAIDFTFRYVPAAVCSTPINYEVSACL